MRVWAPHRPLVRSSSVRARVDMGLVRGASGG